jgi:peptidylprolyl isomerase
MAHSPRDRRAVRALALPIAFAACLGSSDNSSTGPEPYVPAAGATIETTTFAPELAVNLATSTRTATGVYYRELQAGTDTTTAAVGRSASVRYIGAFPNGAVFDFSRNGQADYVFTVGDSTSATRSIGGFSDGVAGMRVGSQRQIIIPPERGYGAQGRSGIPGNAVLVFTVQLTGVR